MITIRTSAVLVLLAASLAAQPPACSGWTLVHGWNILPDVNSVFLMANPGAMPLTNGPEDIAYNPTTNTIFVVQDNPNASPDFLLQYALDGAFVAGALNVPGPGGLCAHPNGNLLLSSGNSIAEIDAAGNTVAGGVNLTLAGYGNIQDLDFDGSGNLWVHDGNSGDFSQVDLTTGAVTQQFVASFGAQGFCFRDDTGVIVAAGAFFNPGTVGQDTLVEVDPATGSILCQGAGPNATGLTANGDPCNASLGSFNILNGLTWIDPLNEIAADFFFMYGGSNPPIYGAMNVARFAPAGTGFVGTIGLPGTRSGSGNAYRLLAGGDAVIGGTGFDLTFTENESGGFLLWAFSVARDCNDPLIDPVTTSHLFIDPFLPNGTFVLLPVGGSGIVNVNVDTSSLPSSLAGMDFFSQAATTESLTGNAVSSNALRVRLDLN